MGMNNTKDMHVTVKPGTMFSGLCGVVIRSVEWSRHVEFSIDGKRIVWVYRADQLSVLGWQ